MNTPFQISRYTFQDSTLIDIPYVLYRLKVISELQLHAKIQKSHYIQTGYILLLYQKGRLWYNGDILGQRRPNLSKANINYCLSMFTLKQRILYLRFAPENIHLCIKVFVHWYVQKLSSALQHRIHFHSCGIMKGSLFSG